MIKRTGLAKRTIAKITSKKSLESAAAPKFTFAITAGIEKLGTLVEVNEEAALAKARKKFGAPLNYGVFEYTAKRM